MPQELVQRLAQELLRQVRLEEALNPPLAITHVSRRVYPDPFPDAGSIGGPRRLLPGVSPGGAGTREGIPAKSFKPLTAPSTTVERTYACQLVQWSQRERNSPDFSEKSLRAVRRCKGSLMKRRKTAGASKRRSQRRGRASTATQALPRLRAGRDHRSRPGVTQPKRARRYYGQKGRRCEPALVWRERRTE